VDNVTQSLEADMVFGTKYPDNFLISQWKTTLTL